MPVLQFPHALPQNASAKKPGKMVRNPLLSH